MKQSQAGLEFEFVPTNVHLDFQFSEPTTEWRTRWADTCPSWLLTLSVFLVRNGRAIERLAHFVLIGLALSLGCSLADAPTLAAALPSGLSFPTERQLPPVPAVTDDFIYAGGILPAVDVAVPRPEKTAPLPVKAPAPQVKPAPIAATPSNRPTLLKFTADWCLPCQIMDESVFPRREIQQHFADDFALETVNIESIDGFGRKQKFNVETLPTFVLIDENGRELDRRSRALTVEELDGFLRTHRSTPAEPYYGVSYDSAER